jgi:hypothetical protein
LCMLRCERFAQNLLALNIVKEHFYQNTQNRIEPFLIITILKILHSCKNF